MNHDIKVALLRELVELHENNAQFLDQQWTQEPLARYSSGATFAQEQQKLFGRLPQIAAHSSELSEEGAFLTRQIAGAPLLLTRNAEGEVRAFYNVCRHRGARLVDEAKGCKRRFSCPYHAWTYDNQGQLIGVPHEKNGFPGLERKQHGLAEVACVEFGGWVWVSLQKDAQLNIEDYLGELATELQGLQEQPHVVFDSVTMDIKANWKILVEGGIEAYHFKVAHRNSIAPLFLDNLSSYQMFGWHMRSVLPRATLADLARTDEDDWDIRKHSNLLYTLLPTAQFLVQEDHFVWIQSQPMAADHTRLRLCTMVPANQATEDKKNYWQANHDFTIRTLEEDFVLGESIQAGLQSGANEHLNFGRYEGALAAFNRTVDELLTID